MLGGQRVSSSSYILLYYLWFHSRADQMDNYANDKHCDHTIILQDIRTLATDRDEKGARLVQLWSCKHQAKRGGIYRPSRLSPPRATIAIRGVGCHLR